MAIEFEKEILQSRFLDPLRNFNETVYSFEVRFDPLTKKRFKKRTYHQSYRSR